MLGLQYQIGSFFLIKANLSCPRVTSEVTHVRFNMLSRKLLLISLELEEFFAVDSGTASSTWSGQGNARTLSVDRNYSVKPTLAFRFGGKSLRRLESGSEKEAVRTR